jgi:Hpt domain
VTEPSGEPSLDSALAELWMQARPRLLGRLETIDRAVAAHRAGTLGAEEAEDARGEAHKLVGLLGSFGRPAGTEPSRALEAGLAAPAQAETGELERRAAELRGVIEAP